MYIRNYPEDSVLRRHYEAAAELKRRNWRQKAPEDSVLRRHHAQLMRFAAAAAGQAPAVAAPVGGGHGSNTAARQSTGQQSAPQAKGFFGWLGRLFGGG